MDRTAVAKMGAVASASVCALVGGVVLAQYLFTMKKKTGRKTKIIEMGCWFCGVLFCQNKNYLQSSFKHRVTPVTTVTLIEVPYSLNLAR
ncbi:unnamed protein product, partial [Caretta caretta]